jgi:hypothetical protein
MFNTREERKRNRKRTIKKEKEKENQKQKVERGRERKRGKKKRTLSKQWVAARTTCSSAESTIKPPERDKASNKS